MSGLRAFGVSATPPGVVRTPAGGTLLVRARYRARGSAVKSITHRLSVKYPKRARYGARVRRLTSELLQQYIAANMRRLRADRGFTQEGLAEAAGLSLRYLQDVESATKAVSLPALVAVANALDVEAADLLQPATMPEIKRGRPRKTPKGAAGAADVAPEVPDAASKGGRKAPRKTAKSRKSAG